MNIYPNKRDHEINFEENWPLKRVKIEVEEVEEQMNQENCEQVEV